MNPAHLPLGKQLPHLRKTLSTNGTLLQVLSLAQKLALPNWYLAGGAVSQTIWNSVSGLPAETGISDYDLVYFDASDTSYEAEDAAIRRGRDVFAGVAAADVEIRNQARVHLWYESRFGMPCPRHESVEAGIDSWISTSAMIGVRLEAGGEWSVYAPRGLSDFYKMVVRPNPMIGDRHAYEKKARRWLGIWKGLTVMPWPENQTPLTFEKDESKDE
ncbi:Putative nucleotidyltransferase [Colletotrichum destructivum]|uniref:Nucleotidyltransferase n=1 Tax=Colletotrichum destructivum TaxID=34406 RepID=A0AAX4I073_9PEZI|nr:Putative nucleotidyltransferase [Colletotrichum destructivum]